MLQSIEF